MKRILHISKYYYPFRGGTEQVAQDCVKALSGEFEQKVICFNHEKGDGIDIVDGVEVIRCGCCAKVSSQSLSLTYAKILHHTFDSFHPDIVIFHYPNPFVAALLLRYIPKSAKLVLYWHLDIVKQKLLGRFFVKQNRKLLRRADKVIATSPNYIEGSKWLQSVREKCVVVPNSIEVERMELTPEIEQKAIKIRKEYEGKTICVAVGRHTEYKGFTYLIQASKLLDDSFQIFIAGNGELTKKLKKEAYGDKKIHFVGKVSDTELKALIYASDIFCFPSITKNEAFGIALAEGMYFEKPAVTFTIPGSGVNYVSINGITGIECPNRDAKAFADAIKKLQKNKELRDKYGKAARERVVHHFLYEQFQNHVNTLMKDMQ